MSVETLVTFSDNRGKEFHLLYAVVITQQKHNDTLLVLHRRFPVDCYWEEFFPSVKLQSDSLIF